MKEFVIDTIKNSLEAEISNKKICIDENNEIIIVLADGTKAKIKTKTA